MFESSKRRRPVKVSFQGPNTSANNTLADMLAELVFWELGIETKFEDGVNNAFTVVVTPDTWDKLRAARDALRERCRRSVA